MKVPVTFTSSEVSDNAVLNTGGLLIPTTTLAEDVALLASTSCALQVTLYIPTLLKVWFIVSLTSVYPFPSERVRPFIIQLYPTLPLFSGSCAVQVNAIELPTKRLPPVTFTSNTGGRFSTTLKFA